LSKRCDVCLKQFFEGDSVAVDYGWSVDTLKPLEYHVGCFFEKKEERLELVNSLSSYSDIDPPLGYWYFKENEITHSQNLTPQTKVELAYYDCPQIEEIYN
jgi:CRISPR/Cas system-associated endonuclease/helicase Cas3